MKKSLVMSACALCALALVLSGCGGSAAESNGANPGSSSNTSETSSSGTSEPNDTATSDSSFAEGVLTTPTMKIKITDHKIIAVGKKGNEYGSKPVIAFWYETTNLTDADLSPMDFLIAMTAYQDNNPNAENQLEVGALPDEAFLDTQTERIKKGGTVKNAVAYELDDKTTPVVLVASNDLGMTRIGETTYQLK